MVYVGADTTHARVLQNVRFETQAGKVFLLGTRVPWSGDWLAGTEVAIAWGYVSEYVVFPTVQHFKRAVGGRWWKFWQR